ncbi:MAG TPA: hypothetical protein VF483_02730, partial [Gemmatimonadaceae bacterium]
MNFLRRIPFLPALISAAVIVTSAFAVSPVFDSATRGDVVDAFLDRSLAYVVLAPLSDVLDTLTLISAGQHAAILIGALVLFLAWRAAKRGDGMRAHAAASAWFVGAVVVTYAAALFLPRPMAALRSNNEAILKVDFHAHTSASHDGHQSVAALREWHRNAGYDVAYVTDHGTVSAAEQGLADNPNPVGAGMVLLQGIEATWAGEHVSIPNAQRVYKGILTANLADVDTTGIRLASLVPGREPVVIWNHPRTFGALPPATGPGTVGIRAIEIVNGNPRDAGRLRANRQKLIDMAQGGGVSITAGSDNHGFGYATPGWTLMMIMGWRGATSDELSLEIDKDIREGGFRASRVVERRVAEPASVALTAASIFTVPWTMFTTISNDERGWWL